MSLPLACCDVLDLTRILSGPYATMLLAELGANVMKVERPDQGDDTRAWGPPFWNGMSTYFAAVNRGKRGLALDLATSEGRDVLVELAERADVIVENFRPGVTDRLGISYESLRERNPGLIYASITGFGSTGPKAGVAGTEVIVEAETGLMATMGFSDGPPVRYGVAMVDIATGAIMVVGVLAALVQCLRSGQGRHLEFPLYSTAFSVQSTVIASASVDRASQEGRWGSGHPSIVPYAAFEGSDGYVVIGAINELMWERLCTGLELEPLRTDARCASNEARVANRAFVDASIADAVRRHTVDEIVTRLSELGVLVAPVRSAFDAIEDPQVQELGLVDVDDGVKFTRTPLAQFATRALGRAPLLGQHSREILSGFGSVPPERVDELIASGVVQAAPVTSPT